MINRFILNEVSYFGPGAREVLPEVIERLGGKKALVVTDKGLIKFGVAKLVTDVLDKAGIAYTIFSEVKPNPTVTNVKDGIAAFKAAEADFIIAIGGGSSMDTAKAVGIVVKNPEFSDIVSLEGCAPTKIRVCPSSPCRRPPEQLPRQQSIMLLSMKTSRKRWYVSTPTTFRL